MYRQLYMGGGPGITSLNAGAPSIKYEGDIRPQMASAPDPMAELYNMFLDLKRTGQIPQDMGFEQFKDLLREQAMANQPMMDQAMANQPMMDQPMMDQPMMDQPMMDQPMMDQAMMDQPMMANGGLMSLRQRYGLGSKLKSFARKIIPNEISEIAVKAAPFVAPFNPLLAAGMAGIGGFDQTGEIGSSLKSGLLNYGGGQLARAVGGAGMQKGFNPFQGGNPFTLDNTGVMDRIKMLGSSPIKSAGTDSNILSRDVKTEIRRVHKVLALKNTKTKDTGKIKTHKKGILDILFGKNDLLTTLFGAAAAKLSYDDQKKLMNKVQGDFQNQRGEVDKFRKKLDDRESLRGYQTTNVPLTAKDVVRAATNMGGIMKSRRGYNLGSEASMNAIKAAGIEGLPLSRNSMDGGVDINYTETGGFVPPVVGKEKQDKINALLADNEFVMTADAVRGMGEGNVNLGAKRMYDVMKRLEKGGRV
jgi:hypothetical protein